MRVYEGRYRLVVGGLSWFREVLEYIKKAR